MSNIQFVIEGAEASDIALELEHYLKSEWKIEAKKQREKIRLSPVDTRSKVPGAEEIKVLLALYGFYKAGKDTLEVGQDLKKLIEWLASCNYQGIKLDINGTLYPVTTDKIDNIAQELEKQSESAE